MDKFDCCYGNVYGSNGSGVYIIMDNGEEAFAFYSWLPKGTKVMCTLLKKAEGIPMRKTKVAIDSVIGFSDAA